MLLLCDETSLSRVVDGSNVDGYSCHRAYHKFFLASYIRSELIVGSPLLTLVRFPILQIPICKFCDYFINTVK